MINELKENLNNQLKELRKTIQAIIDDFHKETDILESTK